MTLDTPHCFSHANQDNTNFNNWIFEEAASDVNIRDGRRLMRRRGVRPLMRGKSRQIPALETWGGGKKTQASDVLCFLGPGSLINFTVFCFLIF